MSYATQLKKKASAPSPYDDENQANPLLQKNKSQGEVLKEASTRIENKLKKINSNYKTLDQMKDDIGTARDNRPFRDRIGRNLQELVTMIKSCKQDIEEYKNIQVSPQLTKQKNDQYQAFTKSLQGYSQKIGTLSGSIQEQQKLHADKIIQNHRESIAMGDGSSVDPIVQDNLFVQEEQQKQVVIGEQSIQLKNETDYMEGLINQRKQDIDNIGTIMADINAISKDIALETELQGEKLVSLEGDMIKADDNAEQAVVQLKQAAHHQKKGASCTRLLACIILICVIIIAVVIGTNM